MQYVFPALLGSYAEQVCLLIQEMQSQSRKRYASKTGRTRDISPLPPRSRDSLKQHAGKIGDLSEADIAVVHHLCYACAGALNGLADAQMPEESRTFTSAQLSVHVRITHIRPS